MLFGPAIWFCCAAVQAEHELQVLVRFLLVRQRTVVCSSVLCALVAPPAALQRGMMGGHFPPGYHSGTGGTQQVDKTGQSADTQ